jgi:putative transcriptional regulator
VKNNISLIISQKRLSQGDLAEMVGVRREYINRIINRKITPSVDLGMRIAGALEVPVERLFILGES